MSMSDILDTEIERRTIANADLIAAQADIDGAIQQFEELDAIHAENEDKTRQRLEAIYKENRHFTGKQPAVYTSAETTKYPFYSGQTDDLCNPYFPITKVQNKTFDGITPLNAPPSKTGAWARDMSFSPIESTLREPAMQAIAAFPDISSEIEVGTCSIVDKLTEQDCIAANGTWTESYPVGGTATEKLRTALDSWKPVIENIMSDLYSDDESAELSFWQNILDKVNTVLSASQVDVVPPMKTQDFLINSPADLARNYLIANAENIATHISERATFLSKEAEGDEALFFGVVKLRLHQANGSFSKLQAAKNQKATNQSIVADNISAIESLNLLKAKSS